MDSRGGSASPEHRSVAWDHSLCSTLWWCWAYVCIALTFVLRVSWFSWAELPGEKFSDIHLTPSGVFLVTSFSYWFGPFLSGLHTDPLSIKLPLWVLLQALLGGPLSGGEGYWYAAIEVQPG